MSIFRKILWLCFLSMGLWACGESVSKTQQSDTSPAVLSDGFGSGDALQQDTVAAPAEPECSDSKPCEAGFLCDCEGSCVEDLGTSECTEDKNCGSGGYCDPCIGRCQDLKMMCAPCGEDNECSGTGSRCLQFKDGESYCGRGCISAVGCVDAAHSSSVGFDCVAIDGIPDNQCLPISGSCESPTLCTLDSDCPPLEYCNADVGMCAVGCVYDQECPTGTVCSALRCQEPCSGDASCPSGYICDDGGHCKPEGGCITAADCPLPETFCEDATKTCQPGCASDIDCKQSKKMCQEGKCVDKPCPGNFWCAFGQVCTAGGCQEAVGPFCATCDPQGDSDAQCGSGGLCLSFQDDDGNDQGSFCAPACAAGDDPCPKGYNCQEVSDQDGQPVGQVCTRDCTYNPL